MQDELLGLNNIHQLVQPSVPPIRDVQIQDLFLLQQKFGRDPEEEFSSHINTVTRNGGCRLMKGYSRKTEQVGKAEKRREGRQVRKGGRGGGAGGRIP